MSERNPTGVPKHLSLPLGRFGGFPALGGCSCRSPLCHYINPSLLHHLLCGSTLFPPLIHPFRLDAAVKHAAKSTDRLFPPFVQAIRFMFASNDARIFPVARPYWVLLHSLP